MSATLSAPSVDEIIAKLGAQSTCDAGLTQDPWHFDTTKPSYGPGASMFDQLPNNAPRQQVLPEEYRNASDEELQERITAAKARLGKKLLILGHFYQRDEIIGHADFVGDSFQLAKNATQRPDADHIVFCGVHFMAETADILSTPEQSVTLPNLSAGCSMADMANIDQVEDCWSQLGEICGTKPDSDGRQQIVPVTYMNSSAALKAFCGRNGGIVCTSSNAHAVLEWAFARGKRVLFFPDQHLGRNTARAMGIPLEEMPLWDPFKRQAARRTRPIRGRQDDSVEGLLLRAPAFHRRADRPRPQGIPRREGHRAPRMRDGRGRRRRRYRLHRLHRQGNRQRTRRLRHRRRHRNQPGEPSCRAIPDKTVFCLDPVVCPCSTMYRIHPAYLAWALENIEQGNIVNRITVDENTARDAKIALQRMLEVHP